MSNISESPDSIYTNKEKLYYRNKNTYPFIYDYDNKLHLGDESGGHAGMYGGYDRKYEGRIWTKSKVISFWDYPKKSEIEKIIKLLEKEFKNKHKKRIKIWDDPEYMIETDNEELVSLRDYVGKPISNWDRTQHMVSPKNKKNREVPSGVGSKRYLAKKPLVYRQKIRQENINELSNNTTTKPLGTPRGKHSYMKNGEDSWEAKLEYWRKLLMKIAGYEVLE